MFTIDRASWIIFSLVGTLLLTMWAVFNRPTQIPPWPDAIQGVSFSPFRAGQSPLDIDYPDEQQISEDLTLLSESVRSVRTYSMEHTLSSIPRLASPLGLKVTAGVWISADIERNWQEIATLRQVLQEDSQNIAGIVVGNEVLLRNEISAEQLATYADIVRSISGDIPVTIAETWDIWLKNPELTEHVDYITAHVLPYWEGIPAELAPEYVFERHDDLRRRYPEKALVLGEVGWPSEGRQRGAAIPSRTNQAIFLRQFLNQAESRGADYFVLEAFDQVWKTDEGAVGRYWGIFDAQRNAKFAFTEPVHAFAAWRSMAGASLFVSLALLALLLCDSRKLARRGRGFLVVVSQGLAMMMVWMVHEQSQKYMTWDQLLIGMAVLLAALCISILLLAEAHEWAEAIWNRRLDLPEPPLRRNSQRHPTPTPTPNQHQHQHQHQHQDQSRHPPPRVSIHVPIHNEPPDMVIETLAALRDLNYDNHEVVVVDNNTSNADCWKPVQQWCLRQGGERFRFHHVDPLEGYKAGALNHAMRHTDDNADLIAVIDSDYVVHPDWLKDCTAAFEDPEIAIVQAPQDYRDAGDSLFKTMIYAEYAGFFGIGMINRNARNAIIQHGTMTIVRCSALQAVNGWAQWCITEDAELGLRILEQGHQAHYVPRSYGRGLMPDNFRDYRKQRFRWAYGSVLILRHHWRQFLSAGRSGLTPGQRYHFVAGWLPWMADGLCLFFNCAALLYSVLLIMFPHTFNPPEVMLSLLPIGYFAFKLIKMMALYRWRLQAGLCQSLGAALAGLSLSHTIARAMLAGLHDSGIGFFRTPKLAEGRSLYRAIADVREECLIATALILAAMCISTRDDAYLTDTRLWITLLLIQSTPYLAAATLSLVGTFARQRLARTDSRGSLPRLLPDALIRFEP